MSSIINKTLTDFVISSVNDMLCNDISPAEIHNIFDEYLKSKFPAGLFRMEMIPAGIYIEDDVVSKENISNGQIIKYLNTIKTDIPKITRDAVKDKQTLHVVEINR